MRSRFHPWGNDSISSAARTLVVPPGEGRVIQTFGDTLQVKFDGAWSALVGPGGAAYTPRGVRHTFRNPGDTPARAWIIASPSRFETFFTRCAEVFAAGGPPDMARIIAISDEHHIEYVPPLGDGHPTPAMPAGI